VTATVLSGAAIAPLFAQVTELLLRYQAYWQLQPMRLKALPWQAALKQQLEQLSLPELSAIDQSPSLQQAQFQAFFPNLFQLPLFWQAPEANKLPQWPFWLSNGIAGRKLAQIQQFCQFLPESHLPVLEWCAGKGHLGRLVAAASEREVTSIEWQQALCTEGEHLAQRFNLKQGFICADVLSPAGPAVLAPAQQVLALHACGELHMQLLSAASAVGCRQLQISPCCYHLIASEQYQPMSLAAQQTGLQLSRQDLKLAVQGQVTAGERVARLRQTEVTWRLAYDALRARLTGEQDYQPLPSLPKHWFSGHFADFIKFAAASQQLPLPATIDLAAILQHGQQAYLRLQRIDAVRHLFRRPLELYLLLDRALYLQQQGYQVRLQAFCDYQLTPRNFLLQAELS